MRRLKNEQWPDLSQEPVELLQYRISDVGEPTQTPIHATFPTFPIERAIFEGWVDTIDEYVVLADLEYARRFPDQDFSKDMRKFLHFSDEEILSTVRGERQLVVTHDDKHTTFSLVPRKPGAFT